MDVLGRKPRRAPHYDLIALFVPFQDRSRADAELLTNAGGNRNLSLRRDFRMSQCHSPYYHGNAPPRIGPLNDTTTRFPDGRHRSYRLAAMLLLGLQGIEARCALTRGHEIARIPASDSESDIYDWGQRGYFHLHFSWHPGSRETHMTARDHDINEMAANAFDELVAWYTVGIVGTKDGRDGAGIGTGASVLWDGRPLILTAWHVIRETPIEKLWFLFRPDGTLERYAPGRIPPPPRPSEGVCRASIPILGIVKDEGSDIAAVQVPDGLQDRHRIMFYQLASSSLTPEVGTKVSLRGYPSALAQPVERNYAVFANHEYTTISADRPSVEMGSESGFFMKWSSPDDWSPHGFSGAGVWFQDDVSVTSEVWQANPTLAGIATNYFPKSQLLMATRIEVVSDFLRRCFPA